MVSILTGGLVAFIVATGISFGFFYPTFKEREVKISENTTASLLQHMENTLSLVENYMENVAATVEQNNDIQNYLKNIHHFLYQDISLFYYISPISTILDLSITATLLQIFCTTSISWVIITIVIFRSLLIF